MLVFFLVRISFIPLLIKLSEMGNGPWLKLLTKPTPINSNSIPEYMSGLS